MSMFTLVYIKNQFNRPDTLLPFLQSNIGESPLLQIDCISPFQGTEQELIHDACNYLNTIDPRIVVKYVATQNLSSDVSNKESVVNFMVIRVFVTRKP